jgi:hypothetical protein
MLDKWLPTVPSVTKCGWIKTELDARSMKLGIKTWSMNLKAEVGFDKNIPRNTPKRLAPPSRSYKTLASQ